MKNLWVWIEFYSTLPILFLRFMLPRASGYLVVAERGAINFLVWITITLDKAPYEEAVKLGPLSFTHVQSFVKVDEFGFFRKPASNGG